METHSPSSVEDCNMGFSISSEHNGKYTLEYISDAFFMVFFFIVFPELFFPAHQDHQDISNILVPNAGEIKKSISYPDSPF
jgi:hypothetical protein